MTILLDADSRTAHVVGVPVHAAPVTAADQVCLYQLDADDLEMFRSELRGADYSVPVTCQIDGAPEWADVAGAVDRVLDVTPVLRTDVVDADGAPALRSPLHVRADELHVAAPLAGRSCTASNGDPLFQWHYDVGTGRLDLLFHHLVVDADAVARVLDRIDRALEGEALSPSPLTWSLLGENAYGATPLARSGAPRGAQLPTPGTHLLAEVPTATVTGLAAAAAAYQVTPFTVLLTAASLLGYDQIATVVNRRLSAADTDVVGNATSMVEIGIDRLPEEVGDRAQVLLRRLVEVWSANSVSSERAPATRSPLVISHSDVSAHQALRRLSQIRLGSYRVKFRHHVQFQSVGEAWVLEVFDAADPGALRDAFLAALQDVIAAASDAQRRLPLRVVAASPGRRSGQPLLDRVLAQHPDTELRDVGIDSLDVLSLTTELSRRGAPVQVADFYSWRTVGDVLGCLHRSRTTASSQSRTPDAASSGGVAGQRLLLPHLVDVMIDSIRGGAGLYTVRHARRLDPTLDVTARDLAEVVTAVLRRHPVLTGDIEYRAGTVAAVSANRPVEVPVVSKLELVDTTISVRRPQKLWWAAVVDDAAGVTLHTGFHHLLVDHVAIQLLLDEISQGVRGADLSLLEPEPRWSDVEASLQRARQRDLALWSSEMPDRYETVGPRGFPNGDHESRSFSWSATAASASFPEHATALVSLVSSITGARRGVVGTAHHGRPDGLTAQMVAAFARLLPLHYDLDRPAVLDASCGRLLAHPAVTLRDLEADFDLPFPVVVQVLRFHGASTTVFVDESVVEPRTKFAILLELQCFQDEITLVATVATDLLDPTQTAAVFRACEFVGGELPR